MAAQVVELPPVEMVSNGSIAAQDIKACDEKVDIWALGVTLFELLTGTAFLTHTRHVARQVYHLASAFALCPGIITVPPCSFEAVLPTQRRMLCPLLTTSKPAAKTCSSAYRQRYCSEDLIGRAVGDDLQVSCPSKGQTSLPSRQPF